METEVLQSLSQDLSVAASNSEVFGALLVQYGLATEAHVASVVFTEEYSDYQKNSVLLQIVEAKIKAATSRKSARDLFNKLVLVFAEPLGCIDSAQALMTACSKSTCSCLAVKLLYSFSPGIIGKGNLL